MSIGNFDANSVGGWGANGFGAGTFGNFGGGGWGSGIAPFGLFGLAGGFGNFGGHQHGHCGDGRRGDDCARDMVILNAIANNKDTVVGEGRAALAAIAASKDVSVAGFTALANAIGETKYDIAKSVCDVGMSLSKEICDVKSDVKDGVYNLTLQGMQNTQSIKDQTLAFQIANDRKFDELSREGERNTAAILAKLNQTELDSLRDQLDRQRRRSSEREVEISIQNTAIANAQQQQQQAVDFERHRHELDRKFDVLFSQINKTNSDIINLGVMTASGNQATQSTNIK